MKTRDEIEAEVYIKTHRNHSAYCIVFATLVVITALVLGSGYILWALLLQQSYNHDFAFSDEDEEDEEYEEIKTEE